MIIIIHLVEVVPNGELVRRDPVRTAEFVFNCIFKCIVPVNSECGVTVCLKQLFTCVLLYLLLQFTCSARHIISMSFWK